MPWIRRFCRRRPSRFRGGGLPASGTPARERPPAVGRLGKYEEQLLHLPPFGGGARCGRAASREDHVPMVRRRRGAARARVPRPAKTRTGVRVV